MSVISRTPCKDEKTDKSNKFNLINTTTASPSTSTSSSAKSASTSTKTSTPITSSAPYLSAISRTPIERHRPSHAVAAPAWSRRESHARSLSTSSGELTVESMDVTTSKVRERFSGSASERKRTKKNGRHHNT
ncbi:hypothetical protein E2C01_041615 [Portunus trituberculatus]|uniref:Uncharacterized protein n=1 Tax=Portunus trituberculatus TaxID=210409 RepID=A0A5B7FQU4_PORTR|nr:hypothetical protein [Portunus trituberculatus]